MARVWTFVTLATLLGAAGTAAAQPANPYAPPAPPGPATPGDVAPIQDPALAEQVASSLVARAQDLYDARELSDAKQLAVEAVVTSPRGPAADRGRILIHQINVQLGIPEDKPAPPPVPVKPPADPDAPAGDAPVPVAPVPTAADVPHHAGRTAAVVHAGLYSALLGATIGSAISTDNEAGLAVAVGLAAGGAGAVYLSPVLDRHLGEAEIRTIGSGSVWGGVIGGLMADITTGVGTDSSGTSARQVLIGASIGSTVGALAGYGYTRQHELTRGDVALVDTLAGIGTFGGFSVGLLMQPAQSEAYDLNAVLGAAGGVIAGLVQAPGTNTTPRRMLRVAEYAAVGGAVPYLILAASQASGAERAVGALSVIGLAGGAYLGFRTTAHWDEGLDRPDRADRPGAAPAPKADAPPAVVGRASDGTWQLGAPAISALSPQLDNHQHGMGITMLSGAF